MFEIILESLHCERTQDRDGVDECRLDVSVDGQLQAAPLRMRLGRNQAEGLVNGYRFADQVKLTLWDEDLIGDHENLGEVVIGPARTDHSQAAFRERNARYRLLYSVIETDDAPGPTGKAAVDAALASFEQSNEPGLWPNIQKDALLADMRIKLDNPYSLDQQQLPLCGSAAITFELIRRNPVKYVRICQALYEQGRFLGHTKTVPCSSALLKSSISYNISVADWLIMASLRDAENLLFRMSADQPMPAINAAGFTNPREMRGWAFEILDLGHTDSMLTPVGGDVEAMEKAHAAKDAGGVAFLFVDSAILYSAPPVWYPNHWVTYVGGLDLSGDRVRFDCYSWGRRVPVDKATRDFGRYMWGVVTGVP